MKKLALVLGSLLVVGTAATAKEVMPAPVVVPEKVVEVVEKPVIVYRDREVAPAWRPNGSVDVQYRWYGEAENKDVNEDKDKDWSRDKRTNAGRLQTITNINFTENNNLNIRTRNYQSLRTDDTPKGKGNANVDDQLRIRHHYNFGTLSNTKITAKSRLEYKQANHDGEKAAEASVAFDFANYFFSNDYFKVDTFVLRPIYSHTWEAHGNDSTVNEYGIDLETEYSLPLGFSLEFNLYNRYARKADGYFYTGSGLKEGRYKGQYYVDIELYLYNTTNLYKNGNFAVDFKFEGGYDSYTVNQRKIVNVDQETGLVKSGEKAERAKYSLYALPALELSYKPTDFVKLYAGAGAEYRNWRKTAQSVAQNWRWQPTAWAGMKVTF